MSSSTSSPICPLDCCSIGAHITVSSAVAASGVVSVEAFLTFTSFIPPIGVKFLQFKHHFFFLFSCRAFFRLSCVLSVPLPVIPSPCIIMPLPALVLEIVGLAWDRQLAVRTHQIKFWVHCIDRIKVAADDGTFKLLRLMIFIYFALVFYQVIGDETYLSNLGNWHFNKIFASYGPCSTTGWSQLILYHTSFLLVAKSSANHANWIDEYLLGIARKLMIKLLFLHFRLATVGKKRRSIFTNKGRKKPTKPANNLGNCACGSLLLDHHHYLGCGNGISVCFIFPFCNCYKGAY